MRGFALLCGTCLTLIYGFAAQAAMVADRNDVVRRLAAVGAVDDTLAALPPLWYGGTLDPITVEVTGPGPVGKPAAEVLVPRRERLRKMGRLVGASLRIS